ncbi:MAG: CinA family protein [Thermoplasmata archaeon]
MRSPEESIAEILRERGLTLAAAESCTGGRIGDKITNVPGSSDYFLGSAVTYSNDAKMWILGVKRSSLHRYGAVSEQVAKEMALGAMKKFGSDIAVSTTGIAGPTGGSKEKPVGLVWFAVAHEDDIQTDKEIFAGDRLDIKEAAAIHAIDLVIDFVRAL